MNLGSRLRRYILCCICIFMTATFSGPLHAATSEIILEALAKLQKERITDILYRNYLNNLFTDDALYAFFPETAKAVSAIPRDFDKQTIALIQRYVEKDLKTFADLTLECFPKVLFLVASGMKSEMKDPLRQSMADFAVLPHLFRSDTYDQGLKIKDISRIHAELCLGNKAILDGLDEDQVKAFFQEYDPYSANLRNVSANSIPFGSLVDYQITETKEKVQSIKPRSTGEGTQVVRKAQFTDKSSSICTQYVETTNGNKDRESVVRLKENGTKLFFGNEKSDEAHKNGTFIGQLLCLSETRAVAYIRLFAANYLYISEKGYENASNEENLVRLLDTLNVLTEARRNNDRQYYQVARLAFLFAKLTDAAERPNDPALNEREKKKHAVDNVVAVLRTFVDMDDAITKKQNQNAWVNFLRIKQYDYAEQRMVKESYTSYCTYYAFCRDNFFIGSYFGVSVSDVSNPGSDSSHSHIRAFGPVGLEWKFLTHEYYSLSLDIAPLDIGNYISNEFTGDDYSPKASDVIAPSYFLAISSRKHPFAILIGYQDNVPVGEDEEKSGAFISVSFDLPLFTIH